MNIRDNFKSVFDNDYCGADEFIAKVIKPIFGDKDIEVLEPSIHNPTNADEDTLRKANIEDILWVATIDRVGTDPIQVFDITLGDSTNLSRARVGIQRIIRSALFPYSHAFLLFHHRVLGYAEWRFSYVYKQDKNANTTDAKRYTYLFSRELHARTAIDRFEALANSRRDNDALLDAFNVEALSDDFFEKYRTQYAKFVKYITGKEYIKEGGKYVEKSTGEPNEKLYSAFGRDDKAVRDYVKKMMGRITFLHFLQRKGWMNSDKNFMLHLFQQSKQKADYMDKVLEPLFFGILNTKLEDRNSLFKKAGWNLELLGEWKGLPYLNGGLFEQEPFDCKKAVFPEEYFASLFQFFSEYNFTVDENDPDDAEVGVDPEMLGKIFENLLEDNKDKGAFYTPKEIVRYMCQESLIAYLVEKTKIEENTIRGFVTQPYDVAESLSAKDSDELFDALVAVKICDPAIGSGAFPMGLLNELVRCEEALVLGKEKNNDRAHLKREIIKNNIYGVDIEKGAVDIARLRFWLSLVVDEEEPSPLPNLDYKIMQGNSLLESYKGIDLSHLIEESAERDIFSEAVEPIQEQLEQKKDEYYSCGDHAKKAQLKEDIKNLIIQQLETKGINLDLSDIDVAGNTHFFLWHTWFADVFKRPQGCNGFDIVIGNPPYIKEDFNRAAFDGFRETSPYYMGKMDLWYGFACHSIDMLSPFGHLCFIAQNNWTTSAGAKKLRNTIIKKTRILQLIDFNEYMVFGESASIQTMIMLFQRNTIDDCYPFDHRSLLSGASKSDMIDILAKVNKSNCLFQYPQLTRESYVDSFLTFSNQDTLLNKIASGKSFLRDDEATNGIHPHYDFVNNKINRNHPVFPVGTGIFGLSTDERNDLNLSPSEMELVKPYFTSEQVHRYYTSPKNNLWIIYTTSDYKNPDSMDEYPHLKAHLDRFQTVISSCNKPYGLHRSRKEEFFKGEKIVALRKCVGQPVFSYSDFDCYVSATFYVIKTERWDMKFLTGVLNSRLIRFWLKNRGKMQGENYQLDKEPIGMIPLPNPNVSQTAISKLVSDIIREKNVSSAFDSSALERKIDFLVYELYGLSSKEIAIIESN